MTKLVYLHHYVKLRGFVYTICWGDDIDVAPEYLFFLANKDKPEYHQQFVEWGYL